MWMHAYVNGNKIRLGAAGADGKTAYQYAVDGGYTGTEAEFAELMADAATKSYVDSLIEQVKADTMKAMEKIACLVFMFRDGTQQRINIKLVPRIDYGDYSLTYSGMVPDDGSLSYLKLEPPPGYAFTGLAYTWLPALKVGTNNYKNGELREDGTIEFSVWTGESGYTFAFTSSNEKGSSAYLKLEVA